MERGRRGHERDIHTPLTWVALLNCLFGGFTVIGIAFLPVLVEPAGRIPLVVAGVCLIAPGLEIVRRREADSVAPVYLGVAVVLVALLAYYVANPFLALVLLCINGVNALTAAARLSTRATIFVMAAAVVGSDAVLLMRFDHPPALVVLLTVAVDSLIVTPGITVLYFRRQLESTIAQVREVAGTDPLTGLLNRRGLLERLPAQLSNAHRDRRLIAVLMIDLDHFKRYNDRHGHQAGDLLLRAVAEAVRSTVRPGDLVARLGGEELCAVAVVHDARGLESVAERVRAAVEQVPAGVTASVGGVVFRPEPQPNGSSADAETLLWSMVDRADGLLYEAKDAGRNAVRVLVPS